MQLPDRFWAKIHFNLETGCWEWTGAHTHFGYGQTTLERRFWVAHRLAYTAFVGEIPAGLQLDHFACDNPPCCNPWHVRPVTPRENTLRSTSISAMALAKRECAKGHPFDEKNTYYDPDGNRECRTCNRAWHRRARERRRFRLAKDPTLAAHGKRSTYVSWGCRCRECTRAQLDYQERYRAIRGRPSG